VIWIVGEKKYRMLVGQPEGKKPHARWEDDIKLNLREVVCYNMDLIRRWQSRLS